jgi:hypothetical protein
MSEEMVMHRGGIDRPRDWEGGRMMERERDPKTDSR